MIIAVIPACNEEKSVGKVVADVKKYVDRVIVIDDGSIDSTFEKAEKAGAIVARHIINRGVGAATMTSIEIARKMGADIVVTIDADEQHQAKNIQKLVKPILDEDADVVIGSRFKGNIDTMPLIKRIGNRSLNLITSLMYGVSSTDTQSGFRALNQKAVSLIQINVDRYGFCSEMIGEVRRHNLRLEEVPIETIYLDRYKGTSVKDGIKIFVDLMLRRFLR